MVKYSGSRTYGESNRYLYIPSSISPEFFTLVDGLLSPLSNQGSRNESNQWLNKWSSDNDEESTGHGSSSSFCGLFKKTHLIMFPIFVTDYWGNLLSTDTALFSKIMKNGNWASCTKLCKRHHRNGIHCTLISQWTHTDSRYLVRKNEFARKEKPPEKKAANRDATSTQIPGINL